MDRQTENKPTPAKCMASGCGHIARGGECHYRRIQNGERKGQYPSIAELERCPCLPGQDEAIRGRMGL